MTIVNRLNFNDISSFHPSRRALPSPVIKNFDKRGNICYVTAASDGDKKWFHFSGDK
jgi:hypothetical protein